MARCSWQRCASSALIREVGPLRATVITYVNPAVAALLGVTLLNDR
ncbi:MAG TPA: hypothetical protein VIM33_05220 [Gaiellaceae bacterium]